MRYEDVKYQIDRIEGYMASEAQREFMFNLAKLTTCAAEIGTYKGLSAAIISLGMQAVNNTTARYYCIDSFESSNEELNGENTLEVFKQNMYIVKDTHTIPVVGFSYQLDVMRQIPEGLDWIYIDGDHKAESVYTDTMTYIGKVKEGGLVFYHDYTWESVKEGIKMAIRDGAIEKVSSFDDFGIFRKK
jgi:predicted O-methyltransferase YrrM